MVSLNGFLRHPLVIIALMTVAASASGVTLLTFKVNANGKHIAEADARQRVLETTQAAMARDSQWTIDMLKVLVKERRIDPVPPPPPAPVATTLVTP